MQRFYLVLSMTMKRRHWYWLMWGVLEKVTSVHMHVYNDVRLCVEKYHKE